MGRTLGAVATVVVLVGVSGCSNHLDAGTDGADVFAAHFRPVEGVRGVRSGGTNDLPFSGSATVDVALDDGLSDGRLTRLVDDMGEYLATHSNGSLSWSGTVAVDGYTVPLAAKRTPNHRVLGALEQVRHDSRFTGGAIDPSGVALGAADRAGLVSAWDQARTLARMPGLSADRTVAYADADAGARTDRRTDTTPWAAARWVLSSSDADARDFPEIARPDAAARQTPGPTARPGADPPEQATADALRSRATRVLAVPDVEGAVLTPTTTSLRATSAAAQDSVRAQVARQLPDGVALLVSGGAVHRSGAGDSSESDRIVAAVERTGIPVPRIEVTPSSVGFVVADRTAAGSVARAVRSVEAVDGVDRIVIGSDADALGATRQPRTGFAVVAPPSSIDRAVSVSSALAASTPALVAFPTGARVTPELWLTAGSTTDFPALARALRPLGLDGARTQIRLADEGSVVNCTIGDTLDVSRAGSDDQDRRNGQALQDAWTAAG